MHSSEIIICEGEKQTRHCCKGNGLYERGNEGNIKQRMILVHLLRWKDIGILKRSI